MSVAGRATPLVDGIEKVTGVLAIQQIFSVPRLRHPSQSACARRDSRKSTPAARVRCLACAVLTGADCAIPYGILPIA